MQKITKPVTDDLQRKNNLKEVRTQLEKLSLKRMEFMALARYCKENNEKNSEIAYLRAADGANTIYQGVTDLCKGYMAHTMTLDAFKQQSQMILSASNPNVQELNKHRGLKEILVNILAAIVGLGVFYGIAAAIKGQCMLFHPTTNAGKKVNEIGMLIERMQETMPVS